MSALPSVIGRYEVIRQLGQGGMGKVLLAWDPLLERQVTVKLLRDVDSPELRSRFTREARSAARLRHPNIVTVFDVGEDHEQPFIAMEYIQGMTLDEMIKRDEPMTLAREIYLIEQVCAGLAYAHRAAIVHRDIKPANLMVDADGVLKILDFGIVHVVGSATTHSGRLMGTLNYISPEQLTGRPIDQRSDIFAVGAVLYELLTRKQAFPGTIRDGLFHRIVGAAPEPLQTLRPDLPPEVVEIVARALEKDANARYADVMALRADLQRVRKALSVIELSDDVPIQGDSTQIEGSRARAEKALAAGDFEGAIEASEDVLMLRPEDSGAALLLDRARVALDRKQADQWLDQAAALVDGNALTDASSLIDQALTIAPGSPRALQLRAEVEAARAGVRVRDAAPIAAVPVASRRSPVLVFVLLAAVAIAGIVVYLMSRQPAATEPQTASVTAPAPAPIAPPAPLPPSTSTPPPSDNPVTPRRDQTPPPQEVSRPMRPAPLPQSAPQPAPLEPTSRPPVGVPPPAPAQADRVPPPAPAETPAVPPPPVVSNPTVQPTPPPPSAKPPVDEEAAVMATLRMYERAYNSLDAQAVKRLQPSVDVNALARAFGQLREQSVSIRNARVTLAGDAATVTATIAQSFTPRVGARGETSLNVVFRLQKSGDTWTIVDRK